MIMCIQQKLQSTETLNIYPILNSILETLETLNTYPILNSILETLIPTHIHSQGKYTTHGFSQDSNYDMNHK